MELYNKEPNKNCYKCWNKRWNMSIKEKWFKEKYICNQCIDKNIKIGNKKIRFYNLNK